MFKYLQTKDVFEHHYQFQLSKRILYTTFNSEGEQIVLKSPKAFEHIKFISYEVADNQIYYMHRKKRDIDARNAFFAELEKDDMSGIFLRDIIRGEVTLDELCL